MATDPGTAQEAAERLKRWLWDEGDPEDPMHRDVEALLLHHAALSAKVEAVQALRDEVVALHEAAGMELAPWFVDLRAALGSS